MEKNKQTTNEELLPELVVPSDETDHCLGSPSARLSLVEYGDFGNPHCAHVHSIVKEIVRELGDDLCYAFRNYPTAGDRSIAVRAAESAEAADMQGKYWLMHDRLFEHQSELSDQLFQRLARELPLEMSTFTRDLESGAPARRVAADREGGLSVGVEEVPTFFVNGRMYVGSYEFIPMLNALRAPSGK